MLLVERQTQSSLAAKTRLQDRKIRKQWTDWCVSKDFIDADMVYESKIWLYVEETLVSTNSDGSLAPRFSKTNKTKRIGESGVRAHLAAITKLYKEQANVLRTNSHPPPNSAKQSQFR